MANAHFQAGETEVEVLASRAEHIEQTLRLYSWRAGRELAGALRTVLRESTAGR